MKQIFTLSILLFITTTFSQNYKFGKVSKTELEEEFYPLDSTVNAAYLVKSKTIHFELDGTRGWSLVTKVHERIKIYTKEGYKYATKSIRLYREAALSEKLSKFKAITYTINAKGKVTKSKLAKKELLIEKASQNWKFNKFTMPNLQSGSIIEWEYTTRSPFWTQIDNILLQDFIPIKKTTVSVKIPEYFVFKQYQKGFLPIRIQRSKKNTTFLISSRVKTSNIHRKGGGSFKGMNGNAKSKGSNRTYNATINEDIYKVDKTNTPALQKERFVNNYQNYVSMLTFELSKTDFPEELAKYYSTSWDDVSRIIMKSSYFGEELLKSSYFKNDLPTVIAGKNTTSEKIMAILQFVKSKISWNTYKSIYKHKGVRRAYKGGSGNVADINLALTAMLREAGFNAFPVLVSTRSHGVPLYATIKGFNYVIAAIELPNKKTILLDATDTYSLPNILPTRVLNWKGRLIKNSGESRFIDLVPTKHSIEDNNLSVQISADGTIKGMMRSRFTNHTALNYRTTYNHLQKNDIIENLEEKYQVEITNFKISNKEASNKPVGQIIEFNSTDFVEKIGTKLYITPTLFLAKKTNPFLSKTRNYPIDFKTPWKIKNTLSIQIPESYKVSKVPEALAINFDKISLFRFQVKAIGNQLKVISILQINQAVIGQNQYQNFKEFYTKIIEKQIEKIVLEKI